MIEPQIRSFRVAEVKRIELRYNIKIYLDGISDMILLKFKSKIMARTAHELLKNSKKNSLLVDVTDDYETITLDGSKIVYIAFKVVGQGGTEYAI